jgi:hypothetical protein
MKGCARGESLNRCWHLNYVLLLRADDLSI